MISQVKPDQLEHVWPLLLPWVERGLRHGQGDSMGPEHVLEGLYQGDMVLWIAHQGESLQGGMVIEVNQFPRKKVVFVVLLVGVKFDEWVDDMESMLIRYKEAIGADCIEASCRKGLMKKLLDRNWRVKSYILEAPDGR